MIKELTHDPIFLSLKSEVATKEDLQVAEDLLDTLTAHKDGCVGMAANMIGVRKRIITFDNVGCRDTVQDGYNGFLLPPKDLTLSGSSIFPMMNWTNWFFPAMEITVWMYMRSSPTIPKQRNGRSICPTIMVNTAAVTQAMTIPLTPTSSFISAMVESASPTPK